MAVGDLSLIDTTGTPQVRHYQTAVDHRRPHVAFSAITPPETRSRRAFETSYRTFTDCRRMPSNTPPGSIHHHMRLGELLPEWDNALGKSPLECLAKGNIELVRGALASLTHVDSSDTGGG